MATCVGVIQARTGSTRLPGKVVADLGGMPMLAFILRRLEHVGLDRLVVATTAQPGDDVVVDIARAHGAAVIRGPEHDVLERFRLVTERFPAELVVRLTADCPFVDPALVEEALERFRQGDHDYVSNTVIRTFPDGLDVEVVRTRSLLEAADQAVDPVEREHVTPFLYRRPERFRLHALRNERPLGDERWTVDTPADLAFARHVVGVVDDPLEVGWERIMEVVGERADHDPDAPRVRFAMPDDEAHILRWRNDPEAVRTSRTGAPVHPADHQRWFRSALHDPGRPLWVATIGSIPAGQVRLDVQDAEGTVSVAVAAEHRARGIGAALIGHVVELARAGVQVDRLVALVRESNVASARLFERAGFQHAAAETDDGWRCYRWGPEAAT